MEKIWKKIISKGYVVGMVVFMAVLGTVYFVFLKGDDETAGNPTEDVNRTTEKIVFPEETKEPWESSEAVIQRETETTEDVVPEHSSQSEETLETLRSEQSTEIEDQETVSTPSPLPEVLVPVQEPTSETGAESELEATPTPEPTEAPNPVPTPENTSESIPETTPEPTPEATPAVEPEECVHHWLFDSYFQEPTCSNGGLENQICARCGETRTVPGTPTGEHKFVVETQGDCTSAEVVRCEDCNSREVREKNLSNHIDVEDGICYGCGAKTE